MKRIIIIATLVWGCGGADTPVEPQRPLPPPDMDAGAPVESDAPELSSGLSGLWQNASCGDRKYLRSVAFSEDGTFTARDEIAPCPEEADGECAVSGVIEWLGNWTLDGMGILITPQAPPGGRLPEQMPDRFVVLSNPPLSIGEQIGQLVCPYRNEN